MGPQPFSCGKSAHRRHGRPGLRSFNGAAAIQLRKVVDGRKSVTRRIMLQWGRSHSAAESRQGPGGPRGRHRASMGPQPFSCGK